MSWRTHPITNRFRSLGRKFKLNRLADRLIFCSEIYEARFQKMMIGSIHPGDCVWDVGANVGLYTKLFAEYAGEQGSVFAFEPSPINLGELRQSVRDRKNVVVLPIALRKRECLARFKQGVDTLGATSKVLDSEEPEAEQDIGVKMVRGDELVSSRRVRLPNVIKIDIEGCELEVIEGLSGFICDSALRSLCIEVHFGLLETRGLREAPARIEDRLSKAGFRYTWPDLPI